MAAFPNLTHRAALTVLEAAPSPGAGAALTPEQVTGLLRRCGRGDRSGLAERIAGVLRAPALRQPEAPEHAQQPLAPFGPSGTHFRSRRHPGRAAQYHALLQSRFTTRREATGRAA